MPELPPLDRLADDAPLHDVAVLEIDGEFSGYAGRLLVDLGASVVRVQVGAATAGGFDAAAAFLHRDKQNVVYEGAEQLQKLISEADVIVQSGGADAQIVPELDPTEVRARNSRAVHLILTPFGLDGPAAEYVSTDLVRLAAGGLLWLGGYPDTEPVAPFGDQSTAATAIFGVVAVLLALIERDTTGEGRTVDVSAQEVVTQALETSIPEFELTGNVRRRLGDAPREAGTGVYRCADGFVSMVAGRLGTAEAWKRLQEWLVEEGTPGAEELAGEGWDELSFRQRPESILRFSEIFEAFAARHSKAALYQEAQRRSIALAPVYDLPDVLSDPQLAARGFFREAVDTVDGRPLVVPAPPYRLGELAAAPTEPLEAAPALPSAVV
jgi:benzylsuccinate CoA-transferase BbsE subunit